MPKASRTVVCWPNAKRAISWANSTSIKASVRTLAAVASANARNQNCEATAPAKPGEQRGLPGAEDGEHHRGIAQAEIERQQHCLHGNADGERECGGGDVVGGLEAENAAAKADRRERETFRPTPGR